VGKADKIILSILAIEHLGFGIYGLYAPASIADLTGYELASTFAFSEIRAHYTLFAIIGLMALFSIFSKKLAKQTYIIYIIIFGSFIIGRSLNYFLTGELANSIIFAIVAELLVVLLCIWRLLAKENKEVIE
jgi:hypothetical protein